MKRFLDITISLIILLTISIPLLLVCLILKVTGEGKIFFLQNRVGKTGKVFQIIKFATMYENSPFIGSGEVTIKNDPRILPIGHVLRKYKINELPQFINVIKGDMSIIGPRPQTKRCFDAFSKRTKKLLILEKPGISGIGSIIFANEDNFLNEQNYNKVYNNIIMPYKGSLEEWFIKNNTTKNYLKLILLTFLIIPFPRNKYVWKWLKDLPQPDVEIKKLIK